MHASSEVLNIRETCGPFWSGWPKTKWKIIKCSVECTSVDYFECSLGEINYWYENTILLSLSLCLSIRPLCDYFRTFFPGAANTRRQINLGATGWFFRFRTEVFLSVFFPCCYYSSDFYSLPSLLWCALSLGAYCSTSVTDFFRAGGGRIFYSFFLISNRNYGTVKKP